MQVLTFLAPVLVAVTAPLVLGRGEHPGRGVVAALPLCVMGVVLVSQPESLFGGSTAEAVSAVGVAVAIAQASWEPFPAQRLT